MVSVHFQSWAAQLPHREAFKLAVPLIISNLSIPLMGIADTAMLGHAGDSHYLGAVAIGATVLSFMLWAFGFLRMGTTSAVARALGAGNTSLAHQLLMQSLGLGLCLGLALILLQWLILPLVLALMTPDAGLQSLSMTYCRIRLSAAPAVLMTYVVLGWLVGQQRVRDALIITVFTNVTNIILDWAFIVQLNWGSTGAGFASALADFSALALSAGFIYRHMKRHKLGAISLRMLINADHWRSLVQLNSHLFVRTATLLSVFTFFTAQSARFNQDTLAANAIILQLLALTAYILDGYAHAAETLVGHAVGAAKLKRFYLACGAIFWAGCIIAALLTGIFIIGHREIAYLFTDIDTVQTTTLEYFPWLYILPLTSVAAYLFDGIFIGTGQTRLMRNMMLLCCFGVFIPCWYLTHAYTNHGLWLSLTVFNASRSISLGIAFYWLSRHKRWLSEANL